ncbi:glucose-6-phosphate isomerase family protein [Geosporobacter ferrireducens]|uniref:glucose-6-phosphate isomerase n=1 Tax=Geosporobacter ferrireducens TaxID=1424294 RepID=A0A1D8GKM8_9FIRM|nr:glucose-6-phosphate isomerase family protein [Geosporobacter ferrireducens]AOT71453.1 glucose-6-phosphate isomerase [Geosporobacter ferrireducens]MTI57759.1 glucose-6-phosphate isomerase [Geosporobacter ferrireducens]
MTFYPGFDIHYNLENKEFTYSKGVFGPEMEKRRLDDIRQSLKDPNCDGPDVVYTIAMDVGREEDKEDLENRSLLYGACIYAKGRLGNEPVRSQGHVHAVSKSCNSSTPELYEIWHGEAIIFMQETAKYDPGKVFAVKAKPGDVVLVPPGWAHCTINTNPDENMVFGAWCIRDFGFDYAGVRKNGGLAYFPIFSRNEIEFIHNTAYKKNNLIIKEPREYKEFQIDKGIPIYQQFIEHKDKFSFITQPCQYNELWQTFIP